VIGKFTPPRNLQAMDKECLVVRLLCCCMHCFGY
jgi:hypothetical protein